MTLRLRLRAQEPVRGLRSYIAPASAPGRGSADRLILAMGVFGAAAIRPAATMLGDAKNAALAHDFAGAIVILAVFLLMGVFGAAAIRPMLGDAKNAALAHDFAGAIVILAVFLLIWLIFRRWQSGTLY